MVWPVQTHPAQSTGPESKRNSGDGGYFSLDFSFYRTALPEKWISPNPRRRHFSVIPTNPATTPASSSSWPWRERLSLNTWLGKAHPISEASPKRKFKGDVLRDCALDAERTHANAKVLAEK